MADEYFENVKPDLAALCQYNTRRFPPETLRGILHTHKVAVLDDTLPLDSRMTRLKKEALKN